ncbi:hypothetical protein NEMBOFW57_005484 [Staphylotrichum longicolle]|uniref:lytic cellulose monooxygenase (C4-dehydrogenating) n=1 Tax=Staphylotrichum longicolle TaxID=669026 RepID=A0AAD4EWT4_9PEZI|nr:hypothetical protein NEMBOFW57_005484 [Staphylotrichum longicolle]
MAPLSSIVVMLGSLASMVAGHGYLKSITVNGNNYLAWQVGQDDYVTPTPVRYARKLANNGPVPDFTTNNITYLAHCTNNDCKSFKGDSGAVWVKIEQLQGAKWRVTIPPKLAPGEYLLRHEILGLHVAGTDGAQFYPSCTEGDAGREHAAAGGIALPGAYKPEDPGVSEPT